MCAREDRAFIAVAARRFLFSAAARAAHAFLAPFTVTSKCVALPSSTSSSHPACSRYSSAAAPLPTPPTSPEEIEQQIRRMDENFHVIGTWYDAQRSAAFAGLLQALARKRKELLDVDKKDDNDRAGAGDEDAEGRLAERKKQLAEEAAALEAEVAGFRHAQGQHAPVARLAEAHHKLPAHTPAWRRLTHTSALALVYAGAAARSAVNGFGAMGDFVRAASRSVKTFRPREVLPLALHPLFDHWIDR